MKNTPLTILSISLIVFEAVMCEPGLKVGDFKETDHAVNGTVYILSENKLLVKGFSYDGVGPEAFFYVGVDTPYPNSNGLQVFYPNDSPQKLRMFASEDVYLTLPKSLASSDIKYLSVWSRQYQQSYGHVEFHKHHSGSEKIFLQTILFASVSLMVAIL